MAPHDWTTEGSGAGDLKDVVAGGITANASHTFPSVLVCRCLVYEHRVLPDPEGPRRSEVARVRLADDVRGNAVLEGTGDEAQLLRMHFIREGHETLRHLASQCFFPGTRDRLDARCLVAIDSCLLLWTG